MVPDKFNMVDMGGIDLIMMQGEEVPGLYNRLVESIARCRYQCLYNWFFDGIVIPPAYVTMEVNEDEEVEINEGVAVSADDVIHIYSLGPSPVDPEIIPLLAEENGVYNVPAGKDGFNPVTVDVPSYTPVIASLSATENGTYTPPTGVDGYSPVTVNVPSGGSDGVGISTYKTGGDNASLRIIRKVEGVYVSEELSFWPFYNHEIDHYDVNGIVRITYVSPNWSLTAIDDIIDVPRFATYSENSVINTWFYSSSVSYYFDKE